MQEKFNAEGFDPDIPDGCIWSVPIKILTCHGKIIEVPLDSKETTITLNNMKKNDWYKINPDFVGYYRVQYLTKNDMANLNVAIEKKKLNELDRLSLLGDLIAIENHPQSKVSSGFKKWKF